MYGRLEWGDGGGGLCGWKGRRKGEGRGGSGLCGHGWCVWERGGRGGGREGEGGVGDAGFVLPVAYVKNSSNTTNTTSQSVRWPPWLQPKIHRLFVSPITLLSSVFRCLSTSLLFRSPLSTPSPPPSPPIWLGWSSSLVRSTPKCRELERRGLGQNKLEVVASSSLFTPRHASCPSRRRPLDHQDPLLMMSRRVEKKRNHVFFCFSFFSIICSLFYHFFFLIKTPKRHY